MHAQQRHGPGQSPKLHPARGRHQALGRTRDSVKTFGAQVYVGPSAHRQVVTAAMTVLEQLLNLSFRLSCTAALKRTKSVLAGLVCGLGGSFLGKLVVACFLSRC